MHFFWKLFPRFCGGACEHRGQRGHGYRAQEWTDDTGSVCVETLASEPIGEDFDLDGLGGETFFVNARIEPESGSVVRINDMEEPVYSEGASCAAPETCAQLSEIVNVVSDCR